MGTWMRIQMRVRMKIWMRIVDLVKRVVSIFCTFMFSCQAVYCITIALNHQKGQFIGHNNVIRYMAVENLFHRNFRETGFRVAKLSFLYVNTGATLNRAETEDELRIVTPLNVLALTPCDSPFVVGRWVDRGGCLRG